jgi:hypothetical protein
VAQVDDGFQHLVYVSLSSAPKAPDSPPGTHLTEHKLENANWGKLPAAEISGSSAADLADTSACMLTRGAGEAQGRAARKLASERF